MNRLKHNCFTKLATCLFVIAIGITHVEAARKGAPGSLDREEWCASKLDSCIETANDDCDDTWGRDETSLSLCQSSEVNVCKNSYGSSSDCETRDRVGRSSSKAEKIGGKEESISSPNTRSRAKDRLQQKQKIKGTDATKNNLISTDDCTFYGGTVQRDTSCASRQSCLINNSNGCITKAAK